MKYFTFVTLLLIAVSSFGQDRQLRIAVVDTGLDLKDARFSKHLCQTGHKNFVDGQGLEDFLGHGTCVASIIQNYAGDSNYCLMIYKFYTPSSHSDLTVQREVQAFEEAVKNHADIINLSAGGSDENIAEREFIKKHPKTIFVVAAGNEGENLDTGHSYFPASLAYENIFAIGAVDKDGKRVYTSNYGKNIHNEFGKDVSCLGPDNKTTVMTGTSMATGVFTGKLIDKFSKTHKNGVNDAHKLGF